MGSEKKKYGMIFAGVAGCIFLYWILFQPQRVSSVYDAVMTVLSPFIVGSVLAFILNVPMRAIENKLVKVKPELRRTIALLITVLLVLLIIALVVGLLIPQVIDTGKTFVERLPAFYTDVTTKATEFLEGNPELTKLALDVIQGLNFVEIAQQFLDTLSSSVTTVLTGTFSVLGKLAGGIVNLVISIVFAVYCLFRKEILARQARRVIYAFLPEKWCDTIVRVLRLSNSTFSNFLSGQCLEVCILGSMFAVSMAIFQMPYIPLVSVLVAVTAFIPIVGAFAGCALGALFILVDNPIQAVWFVAMFLVLQQIENNLIYPRVVGTSIGLPGMWVLLAVAVGGEVMGVAGMFLMIPMAAVLYVLLREIVNVRLEKRSVDPSKLVDHPPELRSHLSRRKRKERIAEKKSDSAKS